MKKTMCIALLCLVACASPAQDYIYQANKNSNNVHQVTPWGKVASVLNLSPNAFNLRRVAQAPNGKLWIVNFINTTFTLVNPDGTGLQNVVNPTGSVFDIAFDKFGHAWVSGGTSLNEYDANGVFLTGYPLAAAAPLGVCIDQNGNKWVAHRIAAPGAVSRIDGTTGAVTLIPLPAGTTQQPTAVAADYRGVGVGSHIFVIGDGSSQVVELNSSGAYIATYFVATTASLGTLAIDLAGNVWVGNFSNGQVFRINPSTNTVTFAFTSAPNVLGLNFDLFGRLWVTSRVSFSGPQPSELRRYDPATNTLEVSTQVGLGSGSASSTRFAYACVVDPTGDIDGDGTPNITELTSGTSPFDIQSNSVGSLNTVGVTAQNGLFSIVVNAPPSTITSVAASTGIVPAFTLGGVLGNVYLDPSLLLYDPILYPFIFTVPGTFGIPILIPADPLLVGVTFYIQGIASDPSNLLVTNLTGVTIYQ